MSERDVNERRNWKAQTFPYDHFIPDSSRECQYCLTDLQAEILRGIIEPLAWHTRWWSDSDTPIDRDAIEAFRDDLIRRLMMGCCGDEIPVQFRYTSDGVLQRSEDGGTTWTDAPEFDSRNNSPQFPPVSGDDGDDKKCIAATGAALLVKEQVGDNLTDDMTRAALLAIITGWTTTFIQTSNPLEALATVVNNIIFALQIVLLRPALTDTVYDTLQCILYCNMGDDASFNDAQWQQVRSDISDQIGGIAGTFLERLVYLLGAGGLTNLVRAGGAAEGDCSTCTACADCGGSWFAGYNYAGSPAFRDSLISRTDTSITVQSFDRGDGTQVCAITALLADDCCALDWTGTGDPSIWNKAFTPCGTLPTYENQVLDPLASSGKVATSAYFLGGSTPFQMTFTFSTPP